MQIHIFGKGFNYSQDGPGNRLVYHLSGCNLRCPWCSNPEGLFGTGRAVEDEAMIREILSARPMFFDGGGVTFTGGECSLQTDALLHVIDTVRAEGVNVAIESNATTDDFLRLAPACDVVIADYKHADAGRFREVCGGELSAVEAHLSQLTRSKFVHIRIPLIHNFNDGEQDAAGFVRFLSGLLTDAFDVELLSYHEYGKEKWEKCGQTYRVQDGYVSEERMRALRDALIAAGVRVVHT